MVVQLLEAAVQMLKDTRGRPDPVLNMALATCFGKHSSFFATPSVVEVSPANLPSLPHCGTVPSRPSLPAPHTQWGVTQPPPPPPPPPPQHPHCKQVPLAVCVPAGWPLLPVPSSIASSRLMPLISLLSFPD